MDYWDLNKHIQKDHFPLLFITSIVDDEGDYDLYSFMNDYFGYN